MTDAPEPTTGAAGGAEVLAAAVRRFRDEMGLTARCIGCGTEDPSGAHVLMCEPAQRKMREPIVFAPVAAAVPSPETAPTEGQDSYRAGWEVATTAAAEHIARVRAEAAADRAKVARVEQVLADYSRRRSNDVANSDFTTGWCAGIRQITADLRRVLDEEGT